MILGRSSFALTAAAGAALLATACTTPAKKPVTQVLIPMPAKVEGWREIATDADEQRIETLANAWTEGLQEARRADAAGVRTEGNLLDPDAALPRPALTPGSYYCRLVKLGRTTRRAPAFQKFKPFFCFVDVEDKLLTIVKQTGDTRPAGRVWEESNSNRLVFLGSLALGAEKQPKAYGDDPKRDMAGLVERIGLFRWRLVVPWPQGTSKLDVYELTPVEKQPE